MGKIKPTSPIARILEFVNRIILKNSALIVALDRFMADRLRSRGVPDSKMLVMPPWPHEEHLEPLAHEVNPFRKKHNLAGKFVIMYSGNHSPANPLRTLLDATLAFKDDRAMRFLFIGGGLGKKEVEAHIRDHNLTNVISLPYQPMDQLRYSLSAADVHVVSLGDQMVGIVHPCKIYGAMAVGRPILFFGPRPSHISDILDASEIGLHVFHGDTDAAIRAIKDLRALPPSQLAEMGALAQRTMAESLSQTILCTRFCDALEQSLQLNPAAGPISVHSSPQIQKI
jgi:glycosyltransferase involved in cell wall biosynthesis